MLENDNSRPPADDSGWKTTSHVEGVECQTGFLLSPQHSALIAYLLTLTLES